MVQGGGHRDVAAAIESNANCDDCATVMAGCKHPLMVHAGPSAIGTGSGWTKNAIAAI
jgi:hypothetical protein